MDVFTKSPSATHFLTTLTFLTLISHIHTASCSPSKKNSTSTSFILKSCKTTTYPSLCVKTLTPYASAIKANPLKLCTAALAAAIQATNNCTAAFSKLSKLSDIGQPEASAIKECVGHMKDAVYELRHTEAAMDHLGDADREFQWANAKTYASAAITDAETCVDGVFELDRKVKAVLMKKVRSYVSGVEKLMSNALSLINHLY